MKNMRIPTRPAPTIQEARHKGSNNDRYKINLFTEKKKPPPRPPPPNFNKAKSKSVWNLDIDNTVSLIEWSPPNSPKSTKHPFTGSVSSSFSSSTSSLASSKKSLEYDTVPFNNPWNNNSPFPFPTLGLQASNAQQQTTKPAPTIIRAAPPKKLQARTINQNDTRRTSSLVPSASQEPCLLDLNDFGSPPMPSVPPPSPPKEIEETIEPFGLALYEYVASQSDDLHLQPNDIVYLIQKLNEEWYYGRVDDREGMFPANFIEVQVPLPYTENTATALYDFRPQLPGDLKLNPGQIVKVMGRISESWLYGESEGKTGQFPSNFIDKVPPNI